MSSVEKEVAPHIPKHTINYSCKDEKNYVFFGSSVATCQDDGAWILAAGIPECKRSKQRFPWLTFFYVYRNAMLHILTD